MSNLVQLAPEYFPRTDKGAPVSGGDLYVGIPDTDPEVVGNQKQVTALQEDGSQVSLSQPVSLNAGGLPEYNGSTVSLYVTGNYSLKVLDINGAQVHYVPSILETQLSPGNFYYPDSNESDHGIAGNGETVKTYVDLIGSDKATLFFKHDSGNEFTDYTFLTAETIPDNISCIFENGARHELKADVTYQGSIVCDYKQHIFNIESGLGEAICDGTSFSSSYVTADNFGALATPGDGTGFDSTDAFKAAIKFHNDQTREDTPLHEVSTISYEFTDKNPKMLIPSGWYKITDELEFKYHTHIIGEGNSSILRFFPTTTGKYLFKSTGNVPDSQTQSPVFKDFTCMGAGRAGDEPANLGITEANGFWLDYQTPTVFERINIFHFSDGIGIHMSHDVYHLSLYDCYIEFNNVAIEGEHDQQPLDQLHMKGGRIRHCGERSQHEDSGTDDDKLLYVKNKGAIVGDFVTVEFDGVNIIENNGPAFNTKHSYGVNFTGCYFENNGRYMQPGYAHAVANADWDCLIQFFLNAEESTYLGTFNGATTPVAIAGINFQNCHGVSDIRLRASSTRHISNVKVADNSNDFIRFQKDSDYIYNIQIYEEHDYANFQPTKDYYKTINAKSNYSSGVVGDYPSDIPMFYRQGSSYYPQDTFEFDILAGTYGLLWNAAHSNSYTNELRIYFKTTDSQDFRDLKMLNLGKFIPEDTTFRFMFEDGVHTLTKTLDLKDFRGSGTLYVEGNSADGTGALHTNYQVELSYASGDVISFDNNILPYALIRWFKLTSGAENGVLISNASGYKAIVQTYIVGPGNQSGIVARFTDGHTMVKYTYFDNFSNGIYAVDGGRFRSENNGDINNQPQYGLNASSGVIMKVGSQPTGSVANEQTSNGGVIR